MRRGLTKRILRAALLRRAQHAHRVGDRDEAHVRHAGVRAEDQQVVGVIEVGQRMHACWCRRRTRWRRTCCCSPACRRCRSGACRSPAMNGVMPTPTSALKAVGLPMYIAVDQSPWRVADGAQLGGDLAHRLVPRDALEAAAGACASADATAGRGRDGCRTSRAPCCTPSRARSDARGRAATPRGARPRRVRPGRTRARRHGRTCGRRACVAPRFDASPVAP